MNKIQKYFSFEQCMKYNCSSLFMLRPTTELGITEWSDYGLINSYLEDELSDYKGDYLFVVCKPKDINLFQVLVQLEEEKLNFIEDYDYGGGYVVLVYTIPEELKEDFEKFKRGEYSKLSPKFKNLHDRTVLINSIEVPSLQFLIMYKDPDFKREMEEYLGVEMSKDQELWSVPGEREILSIEKLISNGKCNTDSPKEA